MRYTAGMTASRSTADGKISSPPHAAAHAQRRKLVNLNITLTLQKTEVSHKIKLHRPQFKTRQPNDLGEIAPAVAPVQRNNRNAVPGARRVTIAMVRRQFVERNGSDALAFDYHGRGFGKLGIWRRWRARRD